MDEDGGVAAMFDCRGVEEILATALPVNCGV